MEQELNDIKRIIDDDEHIMLTVRPNSLRYIVVGGIASTLSLLLFGGVFFTIGLLNLLNIIVMTDSGTGEPTKFGGYILLIIGIVVLLFGLSSVFTKIIKYKHTVYIVTDKRVMIRDGLIGLDYKSLYNKDIISLDVRVDLLDKLTKSTGSIYFASAASPIYMNDGNQRMSSFAFAHIDHPYDLYKKIQSLISNK